VPLAGQGGTLGVLTLAMVGSGRRYLPKDLAFAQDVAGRIAAALESARLFRETRQAVEAREHVLGIVSHDLQTPLSGILLAARGLEDTPVASNALAARLLVTIQLGIERMSRMVDDLLDVSSIDAGRLSLDLRDQEAGDLVEDALKSLKPMTGEKNLRLHADPPDRGILVRCDRDRILQVFANLIGNSIKFAPRGGSISIDAVVTPSSMKFAVRDTGPGVDPALLPHLFERYSQATATSRRGRGLGLYICKGIIEAHAGRIWAQSDPSKGLTVFFTLPRAAGAQPTRGGDRARAGRAEGTVMIVDDDDVHRRALADMLQAAGYTVGEARDGLDALEQVRSGRPLPRLILLDLQMPRMDGWELMRQFRNDSALASIPVVLVSGYSRLGAEAEAIGARGYVRKPVRPEQLLEAIGRCGAPAATV
jgi:signal transduction histidine kinase/ActR/RegA family two-component response regulator